MKLEIKSLLVRTREEASLNTHSITMGFTTIGIETMDNKTAEEPILN